MTIKHLVLMGGGPMGFMAYGALKQLNRRKIWEHKDIKSIYATSVGSFLGVLMLLDYKWDTLDDYIYNRPWEKMFKPVNIDTMFHVYNKKGILKEDIIYKSLKPLLNGSNLEIDVTLKEFYDYNNVELHMFSVNMNDTPIHSVDISYKSHPNLKLITAVKMSCSFPILFPPVFYENGCYIDGGLLNNFPLDDCYNSLQCKKSEILAIKFICKKNYINCDDENNNLFNYLDFFIKKLINYLDTSNKQINIDNICLIETDFIPYYKWIDILCDKKKRIDMIQQGIHIANDFELKHNEDE